MNRLVKSLVIRWLTFICPKPYQEAIIGDLLESFNAKHSNDGTRILSLLWEVIASTPSILFMRIRESHHKLDKQVIWTMLILGLSTLMLERFVFGRVVWGAVEAWSIQSILIIRFMYLIVSLVPIIGLCILLSTRTKFKAGLQSILAEPIFSLYTTALCFIYAWFSLFTHFSLDLLAFRLVQFCSVYIGMRLAISACKNQQIL